MTAALTRLAMAVAARALGERRRDWALAMRAEFDEAERDGRPLLFALGCLLAAWRELPAHGEGRRTLAGYALAFVLIGPAASLATGVLFDFPFAWLGAPEPWLNDGNRSALPSLAVLLASLGALHLRLAWLVLDRDWPRAAAMAWSVAATTVTLALMLGLVFDAPAAALTQAAASVAGLAGVGLVAAMSAGAADDLGKARG